ncbi:nitroreductase/quinone reductase family protein [Streptomyces sp. enrichment culture]|uniref:nitroreductase/quinone reductase family protein n=1 Tax=Streptomyces sp. enrichment culture TaxID=1795815 RepID=UPI003F57C8C8
MVGDEPGEESWIIAAGSGRRADWYWNLRAQPQTVIQVGNRRHAVTAHFLNCEDGAETFAGYARRHPRTARRLCAYPGLPANGSEAPFRAARRAIPFVRLDAVTRPRR